MELSQRHREFADYYLQCMNATRSYARVYPQANEVTASRNGYKLLQRPDVRQYIDSILNKRNDKRIMQVEEILSLLSDFARGTLDEEQIVAFKDTYVKTTKQVSPKDRIRALELLGRRYSLWNDKLDVRADMGIHIVVDYGEGD